MDAASLPDPTSWEDLRDKFIARLRERVDDSAEEAMTTWFVIVDHPWFLAELPLVARKLLPNWDRTKGALDDLIQNGKCALLSKIEHSPDLGFSEDRGRFDKWLREVIRTACLEGRRNERPSKPPKDRRRRRATSDSDPTVALDAQLDLQMVKEGLDGREWEVLVIYSARQCHADVASKLGISRDVALHAVQVAQEKARRILTGYSDVNSKSCVRHRRKGWRRKGK
jgi:hypothetical protein